MRLLIALLFISISSSAADATRIKAERTVGSGIKEVTTTARGTCFAISKDIVVTAYHTVNEGQIFIETERGWMKGRILKFDEKLDICLIESKDHGLPILELEIKNDSVNMTASALGAPVESHDGDVKLIRFNIRCAPANSGAPVISEGKVVAMLIAVDDPIDIPNKIYGTAVCVPASKIIKMMSKS